uniref:YDG domain-containing protein n=1 Tax=uncultured Zoogloea sp. TaxID=160237 RepID=UPI0026396DF1
MRRASLNHTYRLVWNDRTNAFVAVAETTRARGKMSRAGRALLITLGVVAASAAGATNLPTGGQIVAGAGTISQSGNTLTITQNTAKLATDWQSFSIGQGSRVNFVQPSASAVALNRVLGSDPSVIQGALSANGQVFLLNPNGVLFTPTAQVNVGGLVASTLGMSNKDFLEGNYRLEGASSNAVINQGNITAANGGSIALIAARVINDGGLTATGGNVLLGAGNAVTLDLGGPVKLQVTQGAIDALVENGGAIRADGGLVYLTTRAANALTSAVINNTGVIEAQTLATGEKGEIRLIADMQYGTLNAGGTLDSRAPNGGDGGFIETSAATVNTLSGLNVMAGAASGTGGTWLIDPYDYTINSTAASTIGTALSGGTSVTVTTQSSNASYGATGAGTGDITVASAITKTGSGSATLTLQADHSIILNSNITASAGALNIDLSAANGAAVTTGGVNINGNLDSNGGWIRIGGAGGSLTTAQSYGTGYALNLDSSNPAVLIGTSKSILSRGGDITINGRSNATTASYDGTKGGVYVKSGATVDSGGGSIYMSGVSTGDAKEFGFGVEANSGTVTTFKTSQTTGNIRVDAQNTIDPLGALGLVNNGNQARVQFIGPSVANLLFLINGSSKLATFTIHPPCGSSYPNCGTLVIPGGNESYTNAGYQVVNMSTVPLYIFTSSGTKEYDGTTAATGLTLSSLGGPVGFATGDLGALDFVTASKNVGSYPSVSPTASNPLNYTSGGTTYAVGYFSNGTYSITPKPLSAVISNKVYDGTNTASVSASGVVGGDNLVFGYTAGTFAGTSVGTWSVNVSGITLGGTDAGNYSLSGSTSLTGTASITQRPVTLTGSRTYDATNTVASGIFTLDNVVSGEDLALSGSGTVADKNVATGKAVTLGTLALGDGSNGTASNYSLASGTADITKAALTVSGLTANNKTYDATTAATLTGTATLNGVLLTDSVSVSGTATGTFNTKNVGTGKPVTANLGGLSLGSTDAGNYEITGVTSPLTAAITKAALTISGLSANSKAYDTTTAATLTGTASLSGVLGSDVVSLGGSATTGTFDTKNVGTGKAVTANL